MSDGPANDDQRPVTIAEIAAATGKSADELLRRLADILAMARSEGENASTNKGVSEKHDD